ncbi:hypothetical protein BpHYR1_042752 [Brachionus plicatilis]|uniref:Uncharacterized protein n=1 Tax=Brachionus plicatilis TaxID=10195 RepID=A0A3M7R7N8_BRAPC|nr:hypothetical protein BpHYR1_042752 [Brachionus plicatilis]
MRSSYDKHGLKLKIIKSFSIFVEIKKRQIFVQNVKKHCGYCTKEKEINIIRHAIKLREQRPQEEGAGKKFLYVYFKIFIDFIEKLINEDTSKYLNNILGINYIGSYRLTLRH